MRVKEIKVRLTQVAHFEDSDYTAMSEATADVDPGEDTKQAYADLLFYVRTIVRNEVNYWEQHMSKRRIDSKEVRVTAIKEFTRIVKKSEFSKDFGWTVASCTKRARKALNDLGGTDLLEALRYDSSREQFLKQQENFIAAYILAGRKTDDDV